MHLLDIDIRALLFLFVFLVARLVDLLDDCLGHHEVTLVLIDALAQIQLEVVVHVFLRVLRERQAARVHSHAVVEHVVIVGLLTLVHLLTVGIVVETA